jgi:hypothetical protein
LISDPGFEPRTSGAGGGLIEDEEDGEPRNLVGHELALQALRCIRSASPCGAAAVQFFAQT